MSEEKVKRIKKVKKRWVQILAPKMFGEKEIGQTVVNENADIIGRKMTVTLGDLTGDLRQYHTNVTVKIIRVEEGKAKTIYYGQVLRGDKILRLVNRWISRIDSIQNLKAEGFTYRIKALTITRRKVNTGVKDSIRDFVKKEMGKFCENKKGEDIIKAIASGHLQKTIEKNSSKIYPIKAVEIRKIEVSE